MVPIELKPSLSSCIETLSQKEYKRTLNLLLKKGPADEAVGERLEVLRLFLIGGTIFLWRNILYKWNDE